MSEILFTHLLMRESGDVEWFKEHLHTYILIGNLIKKKSQDKIPELIPKTG